MTWRKELHDLLPTRTADALVNSGVETFAHLSTKRYHDLLRTKRIGRVGLKHIRDLLASRGVVMLDDPDSPRRAADGFGARVEELMRVQSEAVERACRLVLAQCPKSKVVHETQPLAGFTEHRLVVNGVRVWSGVWLADDDTGIGDATVSLSRSLTWHESLGIDCPDDLRAAFRRAWEAESVERGRRSMEHNE